jgi:hypothetical protein
MFEQSKPTVAVAKEESRETARSGCIRWEGITGVRERRWCGWRMRWLPVPVRCSVEVC